MGPGPRSNKLSVVGIKVESRLYGRPWHYINFTGFVGQIIFKRFNMYYDKKLVPHMSGRPVSPGFVNTPVAPAIGQASLITSQVAPVVSTTYMQQPIQQQVVSYAQPAVQTTVVQEVAPAGTPRLIQAAPGSSTCPTRGRSRTMRPASTLRWCPSSAPSPSTRSAATWRPSLARS